MTENKYHRLSFVLFSVSFLRGFVVVFAGDLDGVFAGDIPVWLLVTGPGDNAVSLGKEIIS